MIRYQLKMYRCIRYSKQRLYSAGAGDDDDDDPNECQLTSPNRRTRRSNNSYRIWTDKINLSDRFRTQGDAINYSTPLNEGKLLFHTPSLIGLDD